MRKINLIRNTLETQITLELNLDECKTSVITTGIGFFDHMLTLFARHSGCTLNLTCVGDLQVDSHHTVEDCGILLGQALGELLQDKRGLNRYGDAFVPMDESLAHSAIDLSGRSFLVFNAPLPKTTIGNFEVEMVEEFFRALAYNAQLTLHIRLIHGSNIHHILEAIFKATARALKQAVFCSPNSTEILSTKGVL